MQLERSNRLNFKINWLVVWFDCLALLVEWLVGLAG